MDNFETQDPKKSKAKQFQFPIKIGDEELYKDLLAIVDRNGEFSDREDWVKYVIQLMKLQDQKVAAQKYDQEIRDFEKHTKRLTEIFVTFVSKVMFQEEEMSTFIIDRDSEIERLKAELLTVTAQNSDLEKSLDVEKEKFQKNIEEQKEEYTEKKKHLTDRIDELQINLSKSNAFSEQQSIQIKEYQNRLDEKDKELNSYKAYKQENDELREEMYQQREKWSSQLSELKNTLADRNEEIVSLKQQIQQSELERDRLLLREEQEHQRTVNELNNDYNKRVRELIDNNNDYNKRVRELMDENNAMRGDYDKKIDELQKTIRELQKQNDQ